MIRRAIVVWAIVVALVVGFATAAFAPKRYKVPHAPQGITLVVNR